MLKHDEQQQLIDVILDSFDKDIEATIAFVEKTLNDTLLRFGVNERTALEFQVLFLDALEQAGYYDKVNDLIDNRFDELFKLVRDGFIEGGFNIKYTSEDLATITALKNLQLEQFNSLANDASIKVQQSLYKYTLSNASLSDIQAQLKQDFLGTNLAKYSTTLARTAIGDYQQSLIDLKAQDLDGVWIYVGPSDEVTRDYCEDVLNDRNYYNDTQKLKVQNNPDRRYNCRHRLRLVSLDYAKQRGYKPL